MIDLQPWSCIHPCCSARFADSHRSITVDIPLHTATHGGHVVQKRPRRAVDPTIELDLEELGRRI